MKLGVVPKTEKNRAKLCLIELLPSDFNGILESFNKKVRLADRSRVVWSNQCVFNTQTPKFRTLTVPTPHCDACVSSFNDGASVYLIPVCTTKRTR